MAIGWMTYMFAVTLLITMENRVMTFPWRKFGLYTVDACPGNRTEWEEASRRLNCTMKPKVFENRYHCVATRNLTRLVEFCYPYTRSFFEKGQCVILDPPFTLNNYNCLHFTDGCPDTPHYTDQLYKYPNCIRIEPDLKCFIADKLCLMRNRVTTLRNEELSTIQKFMAQNTTTQEIVSVSTKVQEEVNLVPVRVPTFIVLGILFGIAIFAMKRWKQKQSTKLPKRMDLEKDQNETDSISNTTPKKPFEEKLESKQEDDDISVEQYVKSSNVRQLRSQEHGSGKETIPLLSDQGCATENNDISEDLNADKAMNKTSEKYDHDNSISTTDLLSKDCKEQESREHDIQLHVERDDFGMPFCDTLYVQSPALQIMIETTRKMLNEFEKEMQSLFVTTRASEKVMKVLEEKRCVFVKGNPGDGKTTLAKHILLKLREQGMKPIQMMSLKGFYEKMPGSSRIVIFLDNMFGERSVSKDEVHYFKSQKDLIRAYLSDDEQGNGNMFIATFRSDIYRECENTIKNIDFFTNSIVDISDTENKINTEEFEYFLSKYALQDTIVSVDEMLKTKNLGHTIGIPQCIKNIAKTKLISTIFLNAL